MLSRIVPALEEAITDQAVSAVLAITVAKAAPAIPMAGIFPKPKINTAFKMMFNRTAVELMTVLFTAWPLFFIMQR